jgi:DUF4097 and DUF4098 domain-containing protein YvlB
LNLQSVFLSISFSFGIFIINAQSNAQFSIQDKSIERIVFHADQVSTIQINTLQNASVQFKSSSEGTYKNDIYFDYEVKNDILYIKSIYPERLAFGDNKMTSMQEFSVKVDLVLPENLSVEITSEMASVEGKGVFKNLIINTKSGHCKLHYFYGNAIINTYDGNIGVTTKHAKISAYSQNGKLEIEQGLVQKNNIDLRSVNGNIKVMQTE